MAKIERGILCWRCGKDQEKQEAESRALRETLLAIRGDYFTSTISHREQMLLEWGFSKHQLRCVRCPEPIPVGSLAAAFTIVSTALKHGMGDQEFFLRYFRMPWPGEVEKWIEAQKSAVELAEEEQD